LGRVARCGIGIHRALQARLVVRWAPIAGAYSLHLYGKAPAPLRLEFVRRAEALNDVIAYLNENVCSTAGRTYAGGLLKFEPKEVERLPIPVFASFADLVAYKHGNEKRRKKSSNMVQPGVAASRGACP
jgi:hypothetical protein